MACGTMLACGEDLVGLWSVEFTEEKMSRQDVFEKLPTWESGLWWWAGVEEKRKRNELRSEEESQIQPRQSKPM